MNRRSNEMIKPKVKIITMSDNITQGREMLVAAANRNKELVDG